jgi:hypothetical protein
MSKRWLKTSWLAEVHVVLVVTLIVIVVNSALLLFGIKDGAGVPVRDGSTVPPSAHPVVLEVPADPAKVRIAPVTPLPEGVELDDFHQQLRVELRGPSLAERVLYRLRELLMPAVWAVAVLILISVVRVARKGDPFQAANVRRLRLLALVITAGGALGQIAAYLLTRELIGRTPAAGLVWIEFVPPVVPIGIGLLVFAIAEVFAHGTRLREDVSGLV